MSTPTTASPKKRTFPPPPPRLFGPRSLASLLDLQPEDTVLLLRPDQQLVDSVALRGARPTLVVPPKTKKHNRPKAPHILRPDTVPGPLPLDDAAVQHIIMPTASLAWWREPRWIDELVRVLAPGGSLLIGANHRLRTPWRRATTLTSSGARRRLTTAGLHVAHTYGVRSSLRELRFLVPLDHPGARRWFFTSAYPSPTARHARLTTLLTRLPRTGLDRAYFPQLLLHAQRPYDAPC
ncbi:hypothetical protein RIF23_18305 [Lipingzhangella sp. LS1_29]|uniref:Methyltransferase family protein n=1 Tax=Lipingzhangella rawalii TaxID=2055835 RepID=A0ABU2HA95_9ACTN|nr:hypothetical protein [Lipingzhangella rawalii]MDS1272245.1 hypothetical protein [Lipingzhangella rawalii]